jgi:hypothetical protein
MAYMIAAMIAVAGLLASIACNIMGWLGIKPPWGESVFVLHIGCLLLWFPLILLTNRVMPKSDRKNLHLLLAAMLPKWMRSAASALFLYAILNFVYFIYCTSKFPKHQVPFYLELRGFSGHWMAFYGIAAIGFIALARFKQKS